MGFLTLTTQPHAIFWGLSQSVDPKPVLNVTGFFESSWLCMLLFPLTDVSGSTGASAKPWTEVPRLRIRSLSQKCENVRKT